MCSAALTGRTACHWSWVLQLDSEVVSQDSVEPAANLTAIFGPEPFAPVAETTGLGAEQMKQGVAVARLARWNVGLDYFLEKMRAGSLDWVQQTLIPFHPGDVICPTATLRMKPGVLSLEVVNYLGQLLGTGTRAEPVPNALLENGLQGGKVFLPDAETCEMLQSTRCH